MGRSCVHGVFSLLSMTFTSVYMAFTGNGPWVVFQRWRPGHSCPSKLREKTEGELKNETFVIHVYYIP